MPKTRVQQLLEGLEALRRAAARAAHGIVARTRDVIERIGLKPQAPGPVALWDGKPKRESADHDSIYDAP